MTSSIKGYLVCRRRVVLTILLSSPCEDLHICCWTCACPEQYRHNCSMVFTPMRLALLLSSAGACVVFVVQSKKFCKWCRRAKTGVKELSAHLLVAHHVLPQSLCTEVTCVDCLGKHTFAGEVSMECVEVDCSSCCKSWK